MINILSYLGVNMQSEVCLWTLLGLINTIFDATLFYINANLKQVWQMSMPEELSTTVQRVLRTMISGVMLVQCFSVYVYLASYIVLLYPVFLEERPNLVLPWLLLAAIRKLLCELTSLALGLATCVLLGPARPPCIKFVIVKLLSIMPSFYMWMLLFTYYTTLKVSAAFKTFPAVLPPSEHDYGLELAIRRRRTKSLFDEEHLRNNLVANLYKTSPDVNGLPEYVIHSKDTFEDVNLKLDVDIIRPTSLVSQGTSDVGSYEDWFGSEVVLPRDTDRILEQFVLMMLRIAAYLNKENVSGRSPYIETLNYESSPVGTSQILQNLNCPNTPVDEAETPPIVGSRRENTASYLRDYPHIFNKKSVDNRVDASKCCPISAQNEKVNKTRVRKSLACQICQENEPTEVEKTLSRKSCDKKSELPTSPTLWSLPKETQERNIARRKKHEPNRLKNCLHNLEYNKSVIMDSESSSQSSL